VSAGEPAEQTSPFDIGPVQMLVLGFTDDAFSGRILPELRRLREHDVVRLLDLLVVRKDESGEIDVQQISDLDENEAKQFGALIGALVGFGTGNEETLGRAAIAGAHELEDGHLLDEDAVWYLADAIPTDSAAAVALIEHRWAIPLRHRIIEAGGFPLADEWIHPADLVAVGFAASRAAETAAH
jgi:uncharacterized membrane protein